MFRPPRRSVRIIGAAEDRDFLMHVRIGIMRALNRHVERVFDPSRKDHMSPSPEAVGPRSRRRRRRYADPPAAALLAARDSLVRIF